MVLDNCIEKEIGGKNYTLKLPIKCLFKAERELTQKSFIVLLANLPMNLEDMFVILKYSLKGGQPNITDSLIEEVYYEAVDEIGLVELQTLLLQVIDKSAAFGKSKKM